MVRGGTKVSHKQFGAQCSQMSYNVLHIKGKGCNISSHAHGQHDSPFTLNEKWGTKNQELTAISKKIWQYLLKRKIKITDREADRESRQVRDSRKLNSTIVMKL